jgi:transcription elongation GreA/GreB family factor
MIPKTGVIQEFITQFEREYASHTASAKAAHEAATHEEAQAEDKHDTRATEASYLAQGQAIRLNEIKSMIAEFRAYLDGVGIFNRISLGSLFELDSNGKKTKSFFALSGGGSQVVLDGTTISVISPKSPLGEAIEGLGQGDSAEVESKLGIKTYTVLRVD